MKQMSLYLVQSGMLALLTTSNKVTPLISRSCACIQISQIFVLSYRNLSDTFAQEMFHTITYLTDC